MATLQNHLENLRSKPDHVRRRIAFWSSFGITAIIFTFWLGSMTGVNTTTGAAVTQAVSRVGSPAQSLVANVGALFGDLKDMIFSPKKVTYSTIEVSPGK